MYDIDFHIAEPMMNMNVEEAQRTSKTRHRMVPQIAHASQTHAASGEFPLKAGSRGRGRLFDGGT